MQHRKAKQKESVQANSCTVAEQKHTFFCFIRLSFYLCFLYRTLVTLLFFFSIAFKTFHSFLLRPTLLNTGLCICQYVFLLLHFILQGQKYVSPTIAESRLAKWRKGGKEPSRKVAIGWEIITPEEREQAIWWRWEGYHDSLPPSSPHRLTGFADRTMCFCVTVHPAAWEYVCVWVCIHRTVEKR